MPNDPDFSITLIRDAIMFTPWPEAMRPRALALASALNDLREPMTVDILRGIRQTLLDGGFEITPQTQEPVQSLASSDNERLEKAFVDVRQDGEDGEVPGWWRVRLNIGGRWFFQLTVYVRKEEAQAAADRFCGAWNIERRAKEL